MATTHNSSHNCLIELVSSRTKISRQVVQASSSKDHLSRFTRLAEGQRKRRALNLSGTRQRLNNSCSSLRKAIVDLILRPRAY